MLSVTFLYFRSEYAKYAKVFPLAKTLDYKLSSKWYRRSVGGLEIFCGLVMMLVPARYHQFNKVVLLVKFLFYKEILLRKMRKKSLEVKFVITFMNAPYGD